MTAVKLGESMKRHKTLRIATGQHGEALQRQQSHHFVGGGVARCDVTSGVVVDLQYGEAERCRCDLAWRHWRTRFRTFNGKIAALRHEPDCITSFHSARVIELPLTYERMPTGG
jgi:hypothetical protein